MTGSDPQKLFDFIPLLEGGALNDAHSIYISTGEYQPLLRELQGTLKESGLGAKGIDWMASIDMARPFLQSPNEILSASGEIVEILLALAINSEEFNKSFFPHLCSSGFMLNLLKRVQETYYH